VRQLPRLVWLCLALTLTLAGPAQARQRPRKGLPRVEQLGLKIHNANPTYRQLTKMAKPHGVVTEYGTLAFRSSPMRRWPAHTVKDRQITAADRKALGRAIRSLKGQKLVETYGKLGEGKDARLVRMIVPEQYVQLGVISDILFPRVTKSERSTRKWAAQEPLTTVFIPGGGRKPRVLVDTERNVTYVLGSHYFGERKKSALRMWWTDVKNKKGAIPLHAAAMTVRLRDAGGKLGEHRTVVLGHSGTGKSTLSTDPEGLNGKRGEGVVAHQDDAGALVPTRRGGWRFVGTEAGMFLKTDGVTPQRDPIAYQGMTSRKGRTAFENIMVNGDKIDLVDTSITKNGRAAVDRKQIPISAGKPLNMGKPDSIVMISRHELLPAIARVPVSRPEKGAFAYALGESVKTSAAGGNGEIIRETAFSSFIVGPPAVEANRMLSFLKTQSKRPDGTRAYIMNTGSVLTGEGQVKVRKTDSMKLLRAMQRGEITWRLDPVLGLEVPATVKGMSQAELDRLTVGRGMSQARLGGLCQQARADRLTHLNAKVPGLDPSILSQGAY
jgi:ATP-dependent phosphoenolpyruvate carboxykinase